MPYRFEFRDGDHRFSCALQCGQCVANTASGARCRSRVCIGLDRCWRHLYRDGNLRIAPSTIPGAGKGVFVLDRTLGPNAIVYRKGETIMVYKGETITLAQLDQRYPGDVYAPYGMSAGDRFEDAACARGVGGLVNHSNRPNARATFYDHIGNEGQIQIRALRHLRNGEEIFIKYGAGYDPHEPTLYTTRYRR